jgi:DNA repair exonuclease SbcCD ATPase subunit
MPKNQESITFDDARLARMTDRAQTILRNDKKLNAYDTALNNYNKRLGDLQLKIKVENNRLDNEYKSKKSVYDSNVAKYKFDIDHAAKPCESCGKIPYADAQKKLETAKIELAKLIAPFRLAPVAIPDQLDTESAPSLPTLEPVIDSEPCVINRMAVEAEIKAGLAAQATIDAKQKQLDELTAEITALSEITYDLDDTIDDQVKNASDEIEALQTQHSTILVEVGKLETQIHEIKNQIFASKQRAADLKAATEFVATSTDLLARWKYIAAMLRPDKIPAMEFDTVTETIDAEATEILKPWRDGAFAFRTRTQKQGASKIVDDFDIMVHDNSTGIEKSFTSYSVGERAMMNDAYVKALIKIRNERSHIEYSPLISDEADSAVDRKTIQVFYAMQEEYYQDEKVIVISHTPDAKNYIPNKIIVKELCT